MPRYNHTREDSELYPCNLCKLHLALEKLGVKTISNGQSIARWSLNDLITDLEPELNFNTPEIKKLKNDKELYQNMVEYWKNIHQKQNKYINKLETQIKEWGSSEWQKKLEEIIKKNTTLCKVLQQKDLELKELQTQALCDLADETINEIHKNDAKIMTIEVQTRKLVGDMPWVTEHLTAAQIEDLIAQITTSMEEAAG